MNTWKVVVGALSAAGGVALLAWLLWPPPGPADAVAPVRQYGDASVCLLTGARGVTGEPQAAVWQGMRDASAATRARAEYLAVSGPATAVNALPYLAGLLRRKCSVVLAVGSAPAAAAVTDARRFPSVRFIAVGDAEIAPPVATVAAGSPGGVRVAVRDGVTAALSQEGRS